MLKQGAFFLLAIVVLLALFLGAQKTLSASFNECQAKYEKSYIDSATNKQPAAFGVTAGSFAHCTGEFIESAHGPITALATLVIAAFTGTLWFATSKQAALSRETLVADKRAFVFAESLFSEYGPSVQPNQFDWRFRPVWKNSGDTPTRGLVIHSNCELRNTKLPAGFNFDYPATEADTGAGMLGPNVIAHGTVSPFPPAAAITPQDLVDVQRGTKFLYLWGWAKYRDVFPETPPRVTRFCWAIIPNGDPFAFVPGTVSPAPGSLTFTNVHMPQGNCADDECA